MSYHHFTISERDCILLMQHSKESITLISKVLGRNKGTISRELSRNAVGITYSPHGVHNSYAIRRWACKHQLKLMKPENHDYFVSGLEQYWSAEEIIGHHGIHICTEMTRCLPGKRVK